jgi:hypothetical protein
MGPYAGVDCILTLMSTLESSTLSLQYIYHGLGQPLCQRRLYPPVSDFGFGLRARICKLL